MSSLFVYICLLLWSMWEVQSERPAVCSFWEWRVGLLTPRLYRQPWPPGLPSLKGNTVCDVCTNRDGQKNRLFFFFKPAHTLRPEVQLEADSDLTLIYWTGKPLWDQIIFSFFFHGWPGQSSSHLTQSSQHKLHQLNNTADHQVFTRKPMTLLIGCSLENVIKTLLGVNVFILKG